MTNPNPNSCPILDEIFERSQSRGTARTVLIAIAWCKGRPVSHHEIAAMTRSSDDSVRRGVRALVDLGELEVVELGGGRTVSRYRVTLS